MATVTTKIKRILKAKEAGQLSGEKALRGLMAEVKGQVVDELSHIGAETYTAQMLRANLASFERYLSAFDTAATREMDALLDAAWDDGADLVPAAMREGGLFVTFGHVPGPILKTLKDFSAYRIAGLAEDAMTKIRGELSLGILGAKTPHQVVQGIAGSLNSPGIFRSLEMRAETIAKVEMGRAYSTATVEGLKTASSSVPEMEKQWWHAGHPKVPRVTHLRLDGQHRPVGEPFRWGGLIIDYPRAPTAPPAEVINCACEVVPWHPKWGASGMATAQNA